MVDQENSSPEADKLGVCHTNAECIQMYQGLSPELKSPALAMLREELSSVHVEIKMAYDADPSGWYVGYHFGWGMSVRNLLRRKGFGEDYFKVHNLDDIYVLLVEDALKLAVKTEGSGQ
jgi:hypothetical protein